MHSVHGLHLFSMSFFIPDHQNILLCASIFAEPGFPKCSASTTVLFSSSGVTILSSVNNKQNRSVTLLKTGQNSLGALFFCLLRTHIFNCNTFGSTEVLCIIVLKSIMELNSAFFKFSSASALFSFGLSIT